MSPSPSPNPSRETFSKTPVQHPSELPAPPEAGPVTLPRRGGSEVRRGAGKAKPECAMGGGVRRLPRTCARSAAGKGDAMRGCGVCGGSPCSLGDFPVNPNLLQKSRCTDNNNLRQEGRALVLRDPDTRAFRTPLRAPPEPQVWPQDREQGPLSTVGYLRTHGASGCPGGPGV